MGKEAGGSVVVGSGEGGEWRFATLGAAVATAQPQLEMGEDGGMGWDGMGWGLERWLRSGACRAGRGGEGRGLGDICFVFAGLV